MSDVIDHRLIGALHVEAVRKQGLHPENEPHVLFQSSTIDHLLDGGFDGDLTIEELAQHGDLGLGTLNALDGEMIAIDGRFLRADINGAISEIDPQAKTPFGVVTFFEPSIKFALEEPLDHDGFVAALDAALPERAETAAVRVTGEFDRVHARSVPRQEPPYPPLADAAKRQHVFEFIGEHGTLVGFRFPDYAQGIEVPGYHLHFVDHAHGRGGHVLRVAPRRVRVELDPSSDLHMELPPKVDLRAPPGADRGALDAIESE
jgi:acetolactate decarboxylase